MKCLTRDMHLFTKPFLLLVLLPVLMVRLLDTVAPLAVDDATEAGSSNSKLFDEDDEDDEG